MSLVAPSYYTVDEFANLKEVSLRTAYDWIKTKKIPSIRAHGMFWVLKTDAKAFVPPRGRYQKDKR